MTDRTIKVLLVDDHAIVRTGVQRMLETEKKIRVTGEAESSQQVMQLVKNNEYDVALVDIDLPDRNGIEVLQMLRDSAPSLAVLILSIYSEEVYAIRAIKNGASGYLTKDSSASVLIEAVRTAAEGNKYVSASLANKMANYLIGGADFSHNALSIREMEVLKMIASGASLNHIANSLHLSPHTVTTYRARILKKTGLNGNAQLAVYAWESGILK